MLLDVTDTGDKTLDLFMYKGQKSLLSSTSDSMDVNQDKPGIISWQLWWKAMRIWADEDALQQPLGSWYKLGNELDRNQLSYYVSTKDCFYIWTMDGFLMYRRNPQNPCTFDNSQHMQWIPTEKTAPVKVVMRDVANTLQGMYCYGIIGDIIYRQSDTMEAYMATLEK
eukprot:1773545-Ditylum_brightwellii.AAC.1